MAEEPQVSHEDGAEPRKIISRRKFVGGVAGAGIGLGLAGILAACGGSSSGETTGGATTEAATATAAGQTAANNGQPLVIGSPYPLSGPAAADGEEMKNGSDLAISEINDAGGVAGRTIEHNIVDTDIYTPEGVTTAFNKLVNDEVDALCIGYIIAFPPSYDVTAPYACPYLNASTQQAQVDLVASDLTKYGYAFQIDPPESYYGISFAPFLDSLIAEGLFKPPAKTIHILEGDSGYSQQISKSAQETAKKLGWEVVAVDPVISGIADWGPLIAKVHATNPSVVMDTHWVPAEIAALMKQWVANPTDSLLYLQYGASVPQFLEIAGDSAEGVVWSTDTGVYNDAVGQAFQERYQTKYGQSAGFSNSGSGYDEVYMMANAWGRTGDPRNFKANIAYIKQQIFRGVNGGYWFASSPGNEGLNYPTQNQDAGLAQACLYYQIQKDDTGKLAQTIISPAPYINAPYKQQPWLSF
jgi:branched-chain amino acid transport system substrate-binding protein